MNVVRDKVLGLLLASNYMMLDLEPREALGMFFEARGICRSLAIGVSTAGRLPQGIPPHWRLLLLV